MALSKKQIGRKEVQQQLKRSTGRTWNLFTEYRKSCNKEQRRIKNPIEQLPWRFFETIDGKNPVEHAKSHYLFSQKNSIADIGLNSTYVSVDHCDISFPF